MRTRSSALRTGWPSIATITSPPRLNPDAVELHVVAPAAQARLRRPGLPDCDAVDDRAVLDGVAEAPRERRRQVLGRDPDVGVGDAPVRDQLSHRAPGGVDRDGEADALGVARVAADLRVDADHAAAGVEQRAARVAVVDRRVGLDRVDEVVARGQRADRALRRRDDADRERVLVAERAADRGHRLADDAPWTSRRAARARARAAPDRRGSAPTSSKTSQPTTVAGDAVAVLELDVDAASAALTGPPEASPGVRDHVRVREHVARRRDDEARALRRLALEVARRAEEGVDRDDAARARRRRSSPARSRCRAAASRAPGRRRASAGGGVCGLDDDRLRAEPPVQPAPLRDRERSRAAEHRGHERDDGDGPGTHESHCS